MKTPILVLILSIFLVSIVSASCPSGEQTWTVPGTSIQTCLPSDYKTSTACCTTSSCGDASSYYFCTGNIGSSYCDKGKYLYCCPTDYPKFDTVTKMCWKTEWQCIQGQNNDCTKVSPNAWCSGVTCIKPKCEVDTDCGTGNYCNKPDLTNPKGWSCQTNNCANKVCADKCEGTNSLTSGSCNPSTGLCQYTNNGVQVGKCGTNCLVDINCGVTGYTGDNYCANNTVKRNYVSNTCDNKRTGSQIYQYLPDGTAIWVNGPTYSCQHTEEVKTVQVCDWKCANGACVTKTFDVYYRYLYDSNICISVALNEAELTPNDYNTLSDCQKNIVPFVYKYESGECQKTFRQSGVYVFSTLDECKYYTIPVVIDSSNTTITVINNATGEKTEIVTSQGIPTSSGQKLVNNWLIWVIVGSVAGVALIVYVYKYTKKKVRISLKIKR
jgi:hypothetical protein